MKIENNIGWCDETINAVTGCDKVSPGCKNCYAQIGTRARVLRGGGDNRWPEGIETWGPKGTRVPVNFEPVFRRLNKLCVCVECHTAHPLEKYNANDVCGAYPEGENYQRCMGNLRRIRLFADSNSDWLDPKWPVETLARFLDAIRLAPNVDVLLLTKRIELLPERLKLVTNHLTRLAAPFVRTPLMDWLSAWNEGHPPTNLQLGVSVENQDAANERIIQLLKTPAAVRFLSVEPLLSPVDLTRLEADESLGVTFNCLTGKGTWNDAQQCKPIDWVIVGGESGKHRRDCGVEAIESVVLQCATAGVPVYCKQDCAFKDGQKGRLSDNAWSFKEFPKT